MTERKTEKPVALVVGAGDFIGGEISKRFASDGYFVCMGRRNEEKLAPVAEEIRASGGECQPFAFDARSEERTEEVFAEIEKGIGPIDIVIFNIGANVSFPIRDTTSRVFRKVWEMACLSGFLTGREAAKYMVPRQRGSIFFTGASASLRGSSSFAAFASAKFGLRAVAQSMARELGPENIHVAHLVIDSAVDTAWVREMITKGGVDVDNLPADRLMDPKSVAEAYWNLHRQSRDAWTFELDVRPYAEKW